MDVGRDVLAFMTFSRRADIIFWAGGLEYLPAHLLHYSEFEYNPLVLSQWPGGRSGGSVFGERNLWVEAWHPASRSQRSFTARDVFEYGVT